ncbi:hypothetical protein QAD02_000894 [Eretmocerus hayati]|uniref:Uncharacterized protein n=1 Tax=Eretmocerus hayati TaxID=131215 RepID=A0ACC2NEP7_9HYME|nr:hypothetical protein QAD02_000894 [Eretmocerus hayati]
MWGEVHRFSTKAEKGQREKARQVRSTVFGLWFPELKEQPRGERPDLDIRGGSSPELSPGQSTRESDGIFVKAGDLIDAKYNAGIHTTVTEDRKWELKEQPRGERPDLDIRGGSSPELSPGQSTRKSDGIFVKAGDLIDAKYNAGIHTTVTEDRKWGTLYREPTNNPD